MTGNIDLESPVVRIFSRSVDRAEMGLPAVIVWYPLFFRSWTKEVPTKVLLVPGTWLTPL